MKDVHYIDESVNEFVFKLSSIQPAPGGGGASALAGALGIALGGMVANLTIGKEKYADVEEDMKDLKVKAYRIQQDLLELVQKDAEAFKPLARAYGLPAGTDEEIETKHSVMDVCLKDAADVPLEMMEKIGEAIELLAESGEKGSKLALSDAACGSALAGAALKSAWINVKVNTMGMRDRPYAENLEDRGMEILKKSLPVAEATYKKIESGLV
jgi:formiminotetrahydrofolate cyclodeaminase